MKNIIKIFGIIALVAVIGFSFAACDNGGGGGGETGDNPPDAPTGVNAVAASSTSIMVSWSAVSGATGYTVYRSTSSSSGYTQVGTPTTNSYSDTGLTAETTYYYQITAKNANGESSRSATASATPSASGGGLPANYIGTWISLTGNYAPYTLTVSADTIKFEDKDGEYIQYTNVQVTVAANAHSTHRILYPVGYTFTGTRTSSNSYSSRDFGYIAYSIGGSVYLGENTSTAITISSGAIFAKTVALPTTYYGEWRSTTGTYQPYTLTVSANGIKVTDKDGSSIQYADMQFLSAENTNSTYLTQYPNGYAFTGTRTLSGYSSGTGGFGFIALPTDRQTVYMGTNASTAITFASGPVFNKVPLEITTSSLPDGAIGTAYSQTTLATTLTMPVTWNVIGALPAGLTLDATTGVISGTPTAANEAKIYTFSVRAAISTSIDDVKDFSISISTADGMLLLKSGSFYMGSPEAEPERPGSIYAGWETRHRVTLTQGFYMGKYPVTQALYQQVMGSNPSGFTTAVSPETNTANRPVERVSWYDALVFCNKLSVQKGLDPAYSISGKTDPAEWGDVPTSQYASTAAAWNAVTIVADSNGYRLPTNAQWEYACRADTATVFSWGDTISTAKANYDGQNASDLNPNSDFTKLNRTTGVGSYAPNPWGLYDMHGNVFEWCWDYFEPYTATPPKTDPVGTESSPDYTDRRVLRNGSWNQPAANLRSAYRTNSTPYNSNNMIGFRVIRPAPNN